LNEQIDTTISYTAVMRSNPFPSALVVLFVIFIIMNAINLRREKTLKAINCAHKVKKNSCNFVFLRIGVDVIYFLLDKSVTIKRFRVIAILPNFISLILFYLLAGFRSRKSIFINIFTPAVR
jgi:hypothetical protein